MKLCDRCMVPITGKVIVLKLTDEVDIVCEQCWLGFLDYLEGEE